MNKFFRLIGFSCFFLIIFLIILGNYSPPDINIPQTYYLHAPTALIWQHITDETQSRNWINQIPVQRTECDSGGVINCYIDNSSIDKIFTIHKDDTNRSLDLKLEKTWFNPYICDYRLRIKLKSLRDGTTEINCVLQYHLKNIMAKIVNKIYFEGYQKNLLEKNKESLQKYFEKV